MQTLPVPRELVLEQLERMLASETFAGAERSRGLLRFLVEQTLANQANRLKEYTLGSEALGRGDSFDPRTDPIVRAEASRLRSRLERYYATDGAADTILITLPKGSYVPQVQARSIPEPAPVAASSGPLAAPGRLQRLIWFVLGGITVGAAVILFVWMRPEAPAGEGELEIRDVDLGGADHSLGSEWGNDAVLSPNGTRIVFVARGSDHVLRLMTAMVSNPRTVVQLPGTDGAKAPFFSPDGRWVGFWADAKIKKVSVEGGSDSITLTEANDFRGASWGEDDDIIAAIGSVLKRVPADPGASPTVVADLNETNEGGFPWWPHHLPGSTHVLFTAIGPSGPDAATIEVLSLSDLRRKPLFGGGTFARYFENGGCLLYINQGTLYAVPFDAQQLEASRSTRVPVLDERVAYSGVFGFAQFDISRTGTLIYRRSPQLVASWLNRGGLIEPFLPIKPGAYTFPRLSPSGQHLAINVIESGVNHTDIHDLRLNRTQHLLSAPGIVPLSPVWHPDGAFLVVGSRTGMSWTKADGLSNVAPLTKSSTVQIPWSFTPDGKRLAYAEGSPDLNLWTIPVSVSAGKLIAGPAESFLQTDYFESYPSFSRDGKWVAYGQGLKSVWEVYVQPFPPDRSRAIQVSQGGGRIALWLPNGHELVYRRDDQRLMVVDYEVKNGRFIVGKPKEWTPERLADTGLIANFDVDPLNGQRILGLVPTAKDQDARIRNQVTVRPRFSDEVRRRLSSGGK